MFVPKFTKCQYGEIGDEHKRIEPLNVGNGVVYSCWNFLCLCLDLTYSRSVKSGNKHEKLLEFLIRIVEFS